MKIVRTPWKDTPSFVRNIALFVDDHLDVGDFYQVPLPFYRIFVVTDPNILHHILVKEELRYEKSRIYWKELRAIIGNALATAEGEDWVWLKRLEMPYFNNFAVTGYMPEVTRLVGQYFDDWATNEAKQQNFNAVHRLAEMNLDIILRTVFGIEADCKEASHYLAGGEDIIAWRSKYPWRRYTARLTGRNRKAAVYSGWFDDFAGREIARTRSSPNPPPNFFTRLVQQMDPEEGRPLTQKDIRNELITHLGGSTETLAVGESWALMLLAQYTHYQRLVREEVEKVTGGAPLAPEHLPKLELTERVVKEALRLYPPTQGIVRDCVAEEDEINGIRIKKGDTLFVSTWGIHRNPRLWRDPDVFRPERFLEEDRFPKYAYIPFGVGRHTCIGRFLAMPQMILTIAAFCRRFEFVRSDDHPIKPLSLSTLKPEPHILLNLIAR